MASTSKSWFLGNTSAETTDHLESIEASFGVTKLVISKKGRTRLPLGLIFTSKLGFSYRLKARVTGSTEALGPSRCHFAAGGIVIEL